MLLNLPEDHVSLISRGESVIDYIPVSFQKEHLSNNIESWKNQNASDLKSFLLFMTVLKGLYMEFEMFLSKKYI